MKEIFDLNVKDDMEIDEGSTNKSSTLDALLGSNGQTILEEYQQKVEEMRKELNERNKQFKSLQKDYEMLLESSQ